MAYDPTIAPQYVGGGYAGGGYGGWGGGFGGVGLFGLVGLLGARGLGGHDEYDGKRRDCCEKELDLINDNMNSRFNAIEAKQNTMQLEGQLSGLSTRFDTFKDFALTAFGDIKTGEALIGKDIVIAEKDIIHIMDKCCCEQIKTADAHFAALQHQADKNTCAIISSSAENTQKLLDKLCEQETARLRDEITELRAFRNIRNTADIVAATTVRATTVGSNFNTGTQTQSNNSGQIVGQ